MKWWPWSRHPSPLVQEAQVKLEQVQADDNRVDKLLRRTQRLAAENSLALAVMKALGARG